MSHNHNLSINSVSSLIEPTTPPNAAVPRHQRSTSILSGTSSSTPMGKSLVNGTSTASTTPFSSGHHQKNNSITSNSLLFAAPPPTFAANNGGSKLWESGHKSVHNLNLPNFNIDQLSLSDVPQDKHIEEYGADRMVANGGIAGAFATNPVVSGLNGVTNGINAGKGMVAKTGVSSIAMNASGSSNVLSSTGATSAVNGSRNGSINGFTNGGSIASSNGNGSSTSSSTPNPNTNGSNTTKEAFSNSSSTTPPPPPRKIDKEYLASINKVPLAQLKPEILKLSKDQYGCRFLQKKIDENLVPSYQTRLANFEVIFGQIHPYLYELIIDPFGNYLIQKLIVYCSPANLDLMLQTLQYNLFQISINQHGTRALQKIIDNLNNQHQLSLLISGLKPYIIELIKDLNGNHVIQKILNKYTPHDCQFMYDSIIEDLYVVASHKHGCCVLQKCLNHVTAPQLQQFSTCILEFSNFQLLINDQFGNYVLQYLISLNSWEINDRIFRNFVQFGIGNLCNLKFSSNVIEKFLKNCYHNEVYSATSAQQFASLKIELAYNVLISDLNKLINDPYGNYVIQTLIDILINPQVQYLGRVEKLGLLLPQQERVDDDSQLQVVIIRYWFSNCKIVSSFGKRIQSKINAVLNERPQGSSMGQMGQMNQMGQISNQQSSNKGYPMNMGQMGQPTGYRNLSVSSEKSVSSLSSSVPSQGPSVTRNLSLPLGFNEQPSAMTGNEYIPKEYTYGYSQYQQQPPPQQQQQQQQQQKLLQTPQQMVHSHKLSYSQEQLQQQPYTHYTTAADLQQRSQYTPPPMNYQYQQYPSLNQPQQMPQQFQQQLQQQQPPYVQKQQQHQQFGIPQQPQQYLPNNGWMKM